MCQLENCFFQDNFFTVCLSPIWKASRTAERIKKSATERKKKSGVELKLKIYTEVKTKTQLLSVCSWKAEKEYQVKVVFLSQIALFFIRFILFGRTELLNSFGAFFLIWKLVFFHTKIVFTCYSHFLLLRILSLILAIVDSGIQAWIS